jgi:hypothetical protein
MDILITFDDGSTETRPSNSDCRRYSGDDSVTPLGTWYGCAVFVERDGAWSKARVERAGEQIDRLTRERDAARRLAALCLRSITGPEVAEMRALREQGKREGWL